MNSPERSALFSRGVIGSTEAFEAFSFGSNPDGRAISNGIMTSIFSRNPITYGIIVV
jgi:hypothetical protein